MGVAGLVVGTVIAQIVELRAEEDELPAVHARLQLVAFSHVLDSEPRARVVASVGNDHDERRLRAFVFRHGGEIGAERVDGVAKRVVERGRARAMIVRAQPREVKDCEIGVMDDSLDPFVKEVYVEFELRNFADPRDERVALLVQERFERLDNVIALVLHRRRGVQDDAYVQVTCSHISTFIF